MTPAEWMALGALVVGTMETIIAMLPIKPNSTVQLVMAVLHAIFRPK
jgi:hypothetical protein